MKQKHQILTIDIQNSHLNTVFLSPSLSFKFTSSKRFFSEPKYSIHFLPHNRSHTLSPTVVLQTSLPSKQAHKITCINNF
jgi:hypothetical protein